MVVVVVGIGVTPLYANYVGAGASAEGFANFTQLAAAARLLLTPIKNANADADVDASTSAAAKEEEEGLAAAADGVA